MKEGLYRIRPADEPPPPAPPEPTKRLTIDVSEDLHRRIKVYCAARGLAMADVIRDLFERKFPAA